MTRDEARHYARRRRAAIAAGTWQQPVPATIIRDHINTLRATGMSLAAIAHAANLSPSTLAPIAYPEHADARRTVTPHTARAILAVKVTDTPDWAFLPNVGTRRRIEALQWMGWPLSELAARLGVSVACVSHAKRQARVSAARARKIAALYDDLCMTPGPDRKTRTWAMKAGAVGPLAWDEDTIDNPAARPHTGATPARGVDLDEFARLVRWGEKPDEAARRCGVTLDAVERATYRQDRPDVRALTRKAVA